MDNNKRFQILLNKTKKEALLIDSYDDEDIDGGDYQVVNLTKFIYNYTKHFQEFSWTLEDEILLYSTDDVSYYNLRDYKALNFSTYNKEAHYI